MQRGCGGANRRRAQQRQQRRRGLNENYGRELLELHTLGVDGGYTQKDIIEVARAFTGWTIAPANQAAGGQPAAARPARRGRQAAAGAGAVQEGEFRFAPMLHDTGEKIVLGHKIKAGGGIEDGEQVLDIVARHPATAHHIAFELAQRFVSDEPPKALVDRAAKKFRDTDGDLREVVKHDHHVRRVLRGARRQGQDAARVPRQRHAGDRPRRAGRRSPAAERADADGHAALHVPAADGLRRHGGHLGLGRRASWRG